MITGMDLTEQLSPSRSLGIIAAPTTALVADELVCQIGKAIGDDVVPPSALLELAQAIAILVMSHPDDGVPASQIVRESQERRMSRPVQHELDQLSVSFGANVADAAIENVITVGAAIFVALGERRIPCDARNMLARVASGVVNHKWGLC